MLLRTTGLVLAGTLLVGVFRAEVVGAKATAPPVSKDAGDVQPTAPALAQSEPEGATDEVEADGAGSANNGAPSAVEYYCCCHPNGTCTMSNDPCGTGTTRTPCPCVSGGCPIIDP